MHLALDTNCVVPSRVGGLEPYTRTLADALANHATWIERLIVLTRPENHALFTPLSSPRCRVILVPRPGFPSAASTWGEFQRSAPAKAQQALHEHQEAKRRILREAGVDLVHSPGNTINPVDLGVPAALNLHDLQHRHLPENFNAEEIANRETWWTASAKRADAVIASTRFVADDIHRELAVPRDRVFVAHPPVDEAFLEETSARVAANVRRRFNLPPTFFLYPAGFWPHKNHGRLIRAFLAARLPNAQLVLTGLGDRQEALTKLVASLGATHAVRVLGRVDKPALRALYAAATAMALPSRYEASSLPVMEAMACGCPVAASNIPGVASLLADAGLLFDPTDERAITTAVLRLARDTALRRELIDRGRARMQTFTIGQYLSDLRAAYEHATSRTARDRAATSRTATALAAA